MGWFCAGQTLLWWLLLGTPAGLRAAEFTPQRAGPDSAAFATDPPPGTDDVTNYLGTWIWAQECFNGQVCQFWQTFEIPANTTVWKARLLMTVDNEYIVYLDGRELGRGAEWRELFDYNLTPLMSPGKHVLAVRGRNSFSFAGMLCGLRIDLADGRVITLKSDATWRLVPDGTARWEKALKPQPAWAPAAVLGSVGTGPWWARPSNINTMPVLYPIKIEFWQKGWFQVLLGSVCTVVILFSVWLMAQLALHRKERLLLQRERARIAMDIHDDLGSRMTQLVLHGEVVQSELPSESSLRPQLDLVCQEAREMLSTLDEILWAVNPRRDTLRDFCSYVCSYAEEFLKPTSIQCRFDMEAEMPGVVLDLPVRRALLMVTKEALNNAVKYSGATELLLQIRCPGRKLVMVVQDNGRGFDPQATRNQRHGLANMAQRMNELGGMYALTSQPGQGCRIEITLALKPARPQPLAWLWKAKTLPALPGEMKAEKATEPTLPPP